MPPPGRSRPDRWRATSGRASRVTGAPAGVLAHPAFTGIPAEQLARVHAPIGIEVGAETVQEIAVSIAAELVAVRRGAR